MFHLIVNPIARKGKTLPTLERLKRRLDREEVPYTVYRTEGRGHAKELAAGLTETPHDLICVGGDGTLSEVLCGIRDFDSRIGIIPCGTGDDFAASANIPTHDPEAALDIILHGTTKPTDYLEFNGFRCLNVAGMGIDADVLQRYERQRRKNRFTYMRCLISALLHLKWMHFELEVDGKSLGTREAMIAAAGNGKYFGGGMMISPESKIDDGRLHLVIVNRLPKWKMLGPLLSFKRGDLLKYSFAESIACERVNVKCDRNFPLNTDGELREGEPLCCRIVPGKLNLWRP